MAAGIGGAQPALDLICPLCKSEYREGISICSDCHIRLVTPSEAQAIRARNLWEGSDEEFFERLMAALDDANVPTILELRGGPDRIGSVIFAFLLQLFFSRFGLFKGYTDKQRGWRIKVLPSDYARAQEIVAALQHQLETELDE